MTLEHVPPGSLGGRPLTLTCKQCNSTAGHTVDAHAKNRERLSAIQRGMFEPTGLIKKTRARLEIEGQLLNVEFSKAGDTVTLNVPEIINDPAKHDQVRMRLNDLGDKLRLRLTPQVRFNRWRASISDLRAAYLVAFSAFGYTWADHPTLDIVREQIRDPSREIMPRSAFLETPSGAQTPQLVGLTVPVKALAVALGPTTVMLPLLDSPPDVYDTVAALLSPRQRVDFEGYELGWPEGMELRLDFKLPEASSGSGG